MGNKQSNIPSNISANFPDDEKFFGLFNFGNTCYLNSVLQSLYFCKIFRQRCLDYYKNNLMDNKTKETDTTLLSCLASLYYKIHSNKARTGVIQPKEIVLKIRKENELFNNPNHQDAHEFLNYFLNQIADDIRRDVNFEGRQYSCESGGQATLNGESSSQNDSLTESLTFNNNCQNDQKTWIQEIFEGVLVNETKCLRCENVTKRDEKFLDLSLDIEENSSLTRCLSLFSSKTFLNKSDKYECIECRCKQEAFKCMKIKQLPKVLVLHLKRFKYIEQYHAFRKLYYRVSFPFHLKVETIDEAIDGERDYYLFAVIIHIGSGARYGHYVSIIKNLDKWFLFDDNLIQMISASDLQNCFGNSEKPNHQDGYILFYQSNC